MLALVAGRCLETPMTQNIRFCTAKDGAKLAYALSGDGPPLVLTTAWLSHLALRWRNLAWQPWLETLSNDYALLRYDARGTGLSERDPEDLSFEAWLHDLESVVDAAGLEQFSILGTSQHGSVAIAYAARHPERVRKLVLFGTSALGRMLWHDRPVEMEKARVVAPLLRLGWGQENNTLLQVWANAFQPGGTLAHWRAWCDLLRAAASADIAVRTLEIGWNLDVREAARNLKCPVLVLHPARDGIVPIEEGRMLVRLIPGSRFVEIDSDNHTPLADEPSWPRVVSEVRSFLGEPAPAVAGRRALALDALTPRERAVLEGIAAGLDNAELAASLGVSEKTVRNHITRVFDKISVKHRYEAIVRAREAGLGANSRLTQVR
jgi:pimeloyl-ACP methyl ester carboxylesterase/DNA-binding CsgD family transcriptional regulator